MTRRDRREWRIIFWVSLTSAAISACFGYSVAPAGSSRWTSMLVGVANSLAIATPIVFFEVRRARFDSLRWLRRLPLGAYLSLKILFYLAVIVGGLILVRVIFLPWVPQRVGIDALLQGSIFFAIGMSVLGNLIFEMGRQLGYGTLRNLLTGRYVQPRREQKVFLLIDMKDSTGLAEQLGPVRFHELLNHFFRDVADAALLCDAEIHKYVGDEAILTWPADRARSDSDCLACPFIVADHVAGNARHYREKFGAVPGFRAALHCGEIVAGEIGDVRREIAYVGDTLNVAARLLDAAKTAGHDVLASADLLALARLPAGIFAEPLPMLAVRGRSQPLGISALLRVGQD